MAAHHEHMPALDPELLQLVFTAMPVEVVIRDRDSRIVFANPAFARTYNLSAAEVVGKLDSELWFVFGRPADEIASWLEEDRQVIEEGETFEYLQEIHRPGGQRAFFQNYKQPIQLADGRICVLAMYWDITARMLVEKALHQTRAEAAELAGIQKTAVTYAHEVNNPLTGILGLLTILLDDDALSADKREMLTDIDRAARRIKDVIGKLERISRPRVASYSGRVLRLDLSRDDEDEDENG
ncbi:PAS domain-containing protein [bacterium]|nr:PAS domain-containing protein [bacterium]